jgi:hypothetical protein
MTPLDYAKRIAYSSEETLMFTYEHAKKYADKEGVYVECGVAAGAQIIAMAYGAPSKKIYAFDSFAGIPLPSNRDDQMPGIMLLSPTEQKLLPDPGKQKLETSGATIVPREDFITNLKNTGTEKNVILVEGWFENILPDYVIEPISILRLDGDLYNSTLVCLQNLYPKVIKGGLVIIDDIELKGCRDACEDYFKSIGETPVCKSISNIAYFYK